MIEVEPLIKITDPNLELWIILGVSLFFTGLLIFVALSYWLWDR